MHLQKVMIYYVFFIVINLLLLINKFYARPYSLKTSNKNVQFNLVFGLNYLILDHEPYIQITGIPELIFSKIKLGFALYLPLEINHKAKIRKITYNSLESILSKVYYLQYGLFRKDNIAIKISPINNYSLGYGLILHHYSNDLAFPEIRKLGLQIQLKYTGVKLRIILGDFFTQNTLGGRISINPAKWFNSKSDLLNSINLGITFVSDINPGWQNVIQILSSTDHKIIRSKINLPSIFIYGGDLSINVIKNFIIDLGFHTEIAKMNLFGIGISYGIHGNLLSKWLNLKYRFQFRHFLNNFIPSYFNNFYDIFRLNYLKNIINNKSGNLGWYLEFGREFYNGRLAFFISYDEIFKGHYRPHLRVDFSINELVKGLYIKIQYDHFYINEKIKFTSNPNSLLFAKILYFFNRFIESGFSYKKGFFIESTNLVIPKSFINIKIFANFKF